MLIFPKLCQYLVVIVIGLFSDLKVEFALLQLSFKHSLNSKQTHHLLQPVCGK